MSKIDMLKFLNEKQAKIEQLQTQNKKLAEVAKSLAELLRDKYWVQTPLDVAILADKVLTTIAEIDLSLLGAVDTHT